MTRWIKQTRLYEIAGTGDCARAAIASLLALDLNQVPDFDANNAGEFYDGIHTFFESRGFELYCQNRDIALDVLHLAAGISPRGIKHMVVRRGREIVHDPHPDGGGIEAITHVWFVIPKDPAVCAASTASGDSIARGDV